MPLTTSWTDEKLRSFRHKTDPLADNLVKKIIESSGTEGVNAIFKLLRENDDIETATLPNLIKDYFETTSILPDWIDHDLIATGQKVFASFGPEISLCLLCKSLPQAYACSNGAQVLYATGRLSQRDGSLDAFKRRLVETAQFVINVGSPSGLDPTGTGIITAQKVRLIHAAIRYYITRHPWPINEYGEPINQQDMAGTLQSFSTLTIEGLEMMKIDLNEEQKQGYYHCWRVVGHIIGLDDELNPPTHQEGYALGKAIFKDQTKASKEGVELTQAICEFMTDLLPGHIFKNTPEAIIRFLVGEDVAEKLNLQSRHGLLDDIVPKLLGFAFSKLDEIEESNALLNSIISKVNLHLLQSLLNHFNEHKQVNFYIPPSLMANWNLK